jgi:SAM-dependent methyltransferase
MSVFAAYSKYYDLLYRDKDYAGEARYIDDLIVRHRPGAQSVLDLGCGTGRHALLLAERGYRMTGVDLSEEMLKVARASSSGQSFVQGDVRSVRLGKTFDVVLSLFHVMSYQTTNGDLRAALSTVREHLAPGGLFVFDCWYGPAVLTSRPETRVKRLEDDKIQVTRLAEPVLHANDNVVDVNYQVLIRDRASGAVEELRETHKMRYLFAPEVSLLLESAGLRLTQQSEFMSEREPGFDTWNAVFIGTRAE